MDWKAFGKNSAYAVANLITNSECVVCGRSLLMHQNTCTDCLSVLMESKIRGKIFENSPNHDRVFWFDDHISLFYWNSYWKKYVYEWKYSHQRKLFKIFLEALEEQLPTVLSYNVDRMGIIDSGFWANRARAYQPCKDIAKVIARAVGMDVNEDVRKIKKQKQSKKNFDERFWSIHNALTCPKKLPHINYLLIEDVYTTGATANEAARMLKMAGARKVIVLSMVYQKDLGWIEDCAA